MVSILNLFHQFSHQTYIYESLKESVLYKSLRASLQTADSTLPVFFLSCKFDRFCQFFSNRNK
jgi:hypothetical protein